MRASLHLTPSCITGWIFEVERVTVAKLNQLRNKGDAHTYRAKVILMSVKEIGRGDVLSCMLQSPSGDHAVMTDWFQSNNTHTLAPRGKAGFAAIRPNLRKLRGQLHLRLAGMRQTISSISGPSDSNTDVEEMSGRG
jgi:hypothetical protein